ncbi:MAG: hypothetical protein CVT82_07015 [Alphaproteobacteria bacterium HGW-Alphaproteobacteria-4]|nr:MAG: hypothetical protein CVT82_07015 [Alphaproteobacteria bacterium HGW-Alphaproteobacteria-4]
MGNDKDIMIGQLHLRLRELQSRNNWTVADMAERTGIPKRTLDKYLLRNGASLPGFDALCSMATGLGVSLDWLVFGAGQPGERTVLIADKAAYLEAIRVLEAFLHHHAAGQQLIEGELILGLSLEAWAAEIGARSGERAREMVAAGVTMEELLTWLAARKERLLELMRDRAERITAVSEKLPK